MIQIHPNYAKASKLMLISYGVYCVVLFNSFRALFQVDEILAKSAVAVNPGAFKSTVMISIIFNTMYFLVLAYLIKQGYYWMKYLLLGLVAFMTFSFATNDFTDITSLAVNAVIFLLRVWIIVLLFQVPKEAIVYPADK